MKREMKALEAKISSLEGRFGGDDSFSFENFDFEDMEKRIKKLEKKELNV